MTWIAGTNPATTNREVLGQMTDSRSRALSARGVQDMTNRALDARLGLA